VGISGLSGLKGRDGNIPLQDVKITGEVYASFSRITITQLYQNTSSDNIEAIYTFPIPDTAAVLDFTARMGKRTVRSIIMEAEEALKTYHDAVEAGDSALLLAEYRPNIFQVSVGQLLPGETVEIEISYLDELKYQDRELRLTIPTVVAPRYIPGIKSGSKKGKGWAEPTDRVPDADFITPVIGEADYRASLDLRVNVLKPASFYSHSHKIKVERLDGNTARIGFADLSCTMDADFVLVCTFGEEIAASGTVYPKDGNEKLLYLTFIPELEPLVAPDGKNHIFVIDISGSMMGEKLEQAKNALHLCLRNLTGEDSFNLIAFNHACTRFAKRFKPFNQQNLNLASQWINSLDASGGTEILQPIEYCLEDNASEKSVILLFTDGEVGNEREIFNYVRRHLDQRRIFTFGIDTAVNSFFLNELARIGHGRAEFIYPGERIGDKVLRQFARIISPAVDDVRIDWGSIRVKDVFPQKIGLIFDLEPLNIFALTSGELTGDVVLKGKAGGQTFESRISLNTLSCSGEADLLEKIRARKIIEQLEFDLNYGNSRRREKIRDEIIRLSKQYGIISSLTSFVAVEERVDKASGLPVTRPVPVAVPQGWKMIDALYSVSSPPILYKEKVVHQQLLFSDEAAFRVNSAGVSMPSIPCCEKVTDGEDETSLTNLLRVLAKKQMADGVFADSEAHDLNRKLRTTALGLLAFLLGDENTGIYANQLRKSLQFIFNALEDGKYQLDLNRDADNRLCLLILLALKRSLDQGIVKRKDENSISMLITQLEKALRIAAQDSEEIRLVMESIDYLEQPEGAALLLDFLDISVSGMPDVQDWEDSPPSALACYIVLKTLLS